MKILDRYIIRQFLLNFVILAAVLGTLSVLVSVLVDLDEYLEAGRVWAAREHWPVWLGTIVAIFDFTSPLLVLAYVYLSGLVAVAAMGFTFSTMHSSRELTAILASGVSMYRIAAPVLIAAAMLIGLSLLNQEFLIPKLAPKIARGKELMAAERVKSIEVNFAADEAGNLLSAHELDVDNGTLKHVSIIKRTENGRAISRITADSAEWQEPTDSTPGRWKLHGGVEESPESLSARSPAAPQFAGKTVEFFDTGLTPRVLLAYSQAVYLRLLSLRDLQNLMSGSDLVDHSLILRIMHSRFSAIILNLLVLTMGLPFFLAREPSNMLVEGIRASGVCLGAWGVGVMLLMIGSEIINPVAAAWLSVVVLLPVASVFLVRVRT